MSNVSTTPSEAVVRVKGDFFSLETHLATYGLARCAPGSRIRWDDSGLAVQLSEHLSVAEMEDNLETALRRAVGPDGWLRHGTVSTKSGINAKASPTVSSMRGRPGDLNPVYQDRAALSGDLDFDDADLLTKFGRPSYWYGKYADNGGTQLIAHIWNSDCDPFVTNFLDPAMRFSDELREGTFGGAEALSVLRNGTGVTFTETEWTPQSSNAIRALVALLGMWAFPVRTQMNYRSITAGCGQRRRRSAASSDEKAEQESPEMKDRSPAYIDVPVFGSPVSVHRVRSVLSSHHWVGGVPKSHEVLREQGVVSRLRFTSDRLQKTQHYATRVGFGRYCKV